MKRLVFSTGNAHKFETGQNVLKTHGIALEQATFEIDEIQGEDPELIARDKVLKAFEIVKRPVLVSDDSWNIPGLNGFPGPYMKSINHWFTVDDFLNLTRPLQDKTIILKQLLVFTDGTITKIFATEARGTLLPEPRGKNGLPSQLITTMEGDDGKTIAEMNSTITRQTDRRTVAVWHDFGRWYAETRSAQDL